ncbi:MAG: RNA polymerase factor sigma-54 [Sedimentisphaerales bacterium]|nr:RNA polymerase factor sigma-54 [Sedimentisphaerales bacterium]
MKLEMTGQMRLEQKMKLAPRMIQSMEILQLPTLELQERIEQELNSNPVLEIEQLPSDETDSPDEAAEKDLAESSDDKSAEDFEKLDGLDEEYSNYLGEADVFRGHLRDSEPDWKLEAIKNTPAPSKSLHEHLSEQWGLVEAGGPVKKAGSLIIDYIDDRGYLTVRLEQLHNKDTSEFSVDDLRIALVLVQQLEPVGVGARDLKECLLLQMSQSGKDMAFEQRLISEHMDELLDNRLPEIAKKMNCSIGAVNWALGRISKLDTSPGLQVGISRNNAISADVVVEPADNSDGFTVRLAESTLPALRINKNYKQMAKDRKVPQGTRKFLRDNIRSALWVIDAIEQRKNTLLNVAKSVAKHQREFFEKGQIYLKPLPMSKVAEDVGVHLATVSRAVAGKYVQCPWGILPLRKFFSGGTEDSSGNEHSWEAIRGQLQRIVDSEDKANPLSDEQIRRKLAEAGIKNLARRTIAKYRKVLNIPATKYRKKY